MPSVFHGFFDRQNYERHVIMENNSYVVYCHTSPNGKKYIGLTKNNPSRRWENGRAYRNNRHFFNAIKKYGWDNFKHDILESDLSKGEASLLESWFIAQYDTTNPEKGYNMTSGGEIGFKHVSSTIKIISENSKRYWGNPVWREMMISKVTKANRNPKVRQKISKSVKKLFNNAEFRKRYDLGRISFKEKQRGVKVWNHRAIRQYTLEGQLVRKFKTVSEAAETLGKPTQDISKCLVGKYKQAYGYIWIYDNDPNPVKTIQEKMSPSKAKRKIIQYNLDGEYIREFDSIAEAKKTLGKPRARVAECARGLYPSAGGYIWKYA